MFIGDLLCVYLNKLNEAGFKLKALTLIQLILAQKLLLLHYY